MIKIFINNEALDLSSGFSIDIEDTNPIFNDRGPISLPVTVPPTPRNFRLLGFPANIASVATSEGLDATICAGPYIRTGKINITESSSAEGISFNVGFDNSTAYLTWTEKRLADLGMPVYTPEEEAGISGIIDSLWRTYKGWKGIDPGFAVFPLLLGEDSATNSAGSSTKCRAWLNKLTKNGDGFDISETVDCIMDGIITQVKVPAGYGIAPFLKVWRLLELIFTELNLKIINNPFKDNIELARLTVLHNCADAICTGSIKYTDLVPDCTVADFLNALWVRFGLVYFIDFDKATVNLELLADLIHHPIELAIDKYLTARERVIFEKGKYIKLSAGTSIDGAAPTCERFEDYSRGLSIRNYAVGPNPDQWSYDADNNNWEGNIREDWWDDPDFDNTSEPIDPDLPELPDDEQLPWDDRDWPDYDGDRDNEYDDYSRSRSTNDTPSAQHQENTLMLARSTITAYWSKLDSTNGRVKESSTPFFNWDPQPDNLEPLDLSSTDEFVPLLNNNPAYLVGQRFYHSYIKGNDTDQDGNTPLAFLFAFVDKESTKANFSPSWLNGMPIDDGTRPTLSLEFQFPNGLFDTFWREYDEVLRHNCRRIEATVNMPLHIARALPQNAPVSLRNVPCLIDKASYTLTNSDRTTVELTLRPLFTQGVYNIEVEQNIPKVGPKYRNLEWRLLKDTFDQTVNSDDTAQKAIAAFVEKYNYTPHGTFGDFYLVDSRSLKLIKAERITRWTDLVLPYPETEGTDLGGYCSGSATFAVHEIHDLQIDPREDPEDYEISEEPIGEITVGFRYHATVIARWRVS